MWAMVGMAALTIAFAPLPGRAAAPTERIFRVEARSFEYTPPVIRVNRGDKVTLELVSTDVVHGIYIDGYAVEVQADPGQVARLTFTADRTGSFRMRCSVTCGALHPFMIGKFQVGLNELLWRAVGLSLVAVVAGILFYR